MEPRRNGPLALLFHATVVLFMLAPLVIDGVACGPQVQQHGGAIVLQEDVVWRDIAVQRLAVVQHPQRPQH